jgi:hypothetical protein
MLPEVVPVGILFLSRKKAICAECNKHNYKEKELQMAKANWTLVSISDGTKEDGISDNLITAYKTVVGIASALPAGAIITVSDLDSANSTFHTEVVQGSLVKI